MPIDVTAIRCESNFRKRRPQPAQQLNCNEKLFLFRLGVSIRFRESYCGWLLTSNRYNTGVADRKLCGTNKSRRHSSLLLSSSTPFPDGVFGTITNDSRIYSLFNAFTPSPPPRNSYKLQGTHKQPGSIASMELDRLCHAQLIEIRSRMACV